MRLWVETRKKRGISQRQMAANAGLAFRTVQLLEWGRLDPRVSTLQKLSDGLGYPPTIVEDRLQGIFQTPPESVLFVSQRIVKEGESSWKIWLFNFVDLFRHSPRKELFQEPPIEKASLKIRALLASTVETLCDEKGEIIPAWCEGVAALKIPWFVSEMENLKAAALLESPAHFRKRNIFVLENFLKRA